MQIILQHIWLWSGLCGGQSMKMISDALSICVAEDLFKGLSGDPQFSDLMVAKCCSIVFLCFLLTCFNNR